MADISDAQNAMVATIVQVLYPNGIGRPSVTGVAATVYPGWPQSNQLDKDLAAFAKQPDEGKVHVTVFPSGAQKLMQPYISGWQAGAGNTLTREVRRQQGVLQVTVWADTPDHRQAVASTIDGALASIDFLTLPDGSTAWLKYQSTLFNDGGQRANLYRRDLLYTVEYPTMQTVSATEVQELDVDVATIAPDGTAVHAFTLVTTGSGHEIDRD